MRKLITIILISISAQVSAQTKSLDTSVVCMPYLIAKQVSEDLLIGDSAQAILELTQQELTTTREKIDYKDSLILSSRLKEINLNEQIKTQKEQVENYKILYENAKSQFKTEAKQVRRQKAKIGTLLGSAIMIITALTYLLIVK